VPPRTTTTSNLAGFAQDYHQLLPLLFERVPNLREIAEMALAAQSATTMSGECGCCCRRELIRADTPTAR
jgi:hypothetical protein